MKFLIISDVYFPLKQPTAKIIERLTNNDNFSKDKFIIISRHKKQDVIKTSPNVINHIIPNNMSIKGQGFFRGIKVFFYKLINKFLSFFYPNNIYSAKDFYKCGQKILKKNKVDVIISVSGPFASQLAGAKLSKQFNIPFYSWYTDPLLFNVNYLKFSEKRLSKFENKWIRNATNVFMPNNYYEKYKKTLSFDKEKFIKVELPCFFNNDELTIINSTNPQNTIIHTGNFFNKFRDPKQLFVLLKKMSNTTNYSFVNYGTMDKKLKRLYNNKLPSNVEFLERIGGDTLLRVIGQASLLVIVDNEYGIQIPSKAFEYISTGKPILLIYNNPESPTKALLDNYEYSILLKGDEEVNDEHISNIENIIGKYIANGQVKDIIEKHEQYTSTYIFNLINYYIKKTSQIRTSSQSSKSDKNK